uniref:TetR/AcrR family transcriptional regulator n=5 Tax=Lachnospiraceae TaxID=186803 RepID=UPI0011DC8DB2
MAKKDQEAKDRIVRVVTELLLKAPEAIDNITVRQIAEQSGVGVGSINYYFGSRDHLL